MDGAGDVFIADSGNNRVVEVQYVAAGGLNGSNCNGAYTGTYNGNLTVSKGQVCTFTNGGVTGNLTQNGGTVVLENSGFVKGNLQIGGSLSISNSTVGNDLQITGANSFSVGPGVSIAGNSQIQNLPVSAGTDQACGASVKGNLTFQNSGTAGTDRIDDWMCGKISWARISRCRTTPPPP